MDSPDAATDQKPVIVICAWNADETGWDPVEDLSGQIWSPDGARTVLVPATAPETLALTLSAQLLDRRARALLLVGRTRRGKGYRMQIRAENRGLDDSERIEALGPCVARTTAPTVDILDALKDAGFSAEASSEAEDDAGNYLLYSVLSHLTEGGETPAIGLLRAPRGESDESMTRAIKTVAGVIARQLAPLPRGRI